MRYKVGIIGCGNIASNYNFIFCKWPVTHIAAYKKHPSTKVVAVSDSNIAKAKECANKWGIPSFYKNYEDMLKKEELDIVSICTPYETHCKIINDVARYNIKAIFCEKPISNSLKEAKDAIKTCNEKNIILTVNYQRRHDKLHNFVKENMQKLVGDVKKVVLIYAGGIINNGSHAFDLMRYYFGEIKNLSAEFDKKEHDPELSVFLKFKSGLNGIITSCKIPNHSVFELSIMGTKAKLDLINKPFFGYDFRYFRHIRSDTCPSVTISSSRPSQPINKKLKRDTFVRAIDDIIKAIEKNKKAESSAENGLAALELVVAAITSARNNKKIRLPFNSTLKLPKIEGVFKEWKKN